VIRISGKAVVIEVGNRHAHAVHFHRQPGALGDIGERAVAIVAIQLQVESPALVLRPVHAVHQQNIQPSIAVVIEKRAARAHRLGKILAPKAPLL
jgi:hypothetical protein